MCNQCSLPFLKQYYVGERTDLLKDLVNLYKYRSIRNCSVVFANLFYECFGEFLKDGYIVPLPTIRKHIRERGFDHT